MAARSLGEISNAPPHIRAWLDRIEFHNTYDLASNLVAKAVVMRRIDVLNWFHNEGLFKESDYRAHDCCALRLAGGNGFIDVLNWMDEHGVATQNDCRADFSGVLRWAASRGHSGVLEWLRNKGAATAEDCQAAKNDALRGAARGGHLNVLEWLRKQGAATPDDCRANKHAVMSTAVMMNNIQVLKWLHQQGAATPDDCRECFQLRNLKPFLCDEQIIEWFAERLELHEMGGNHQEIWWRVLRKKVLLLILAGKTKKLRLPAELWELVNEFAGNCA